MTAIQKVALESASHAQMVGFAETEGLELTADMVAEAGEPILRELLETAGFKTGIYVTAHALSIGANSTLQPFRMDEEFDQENERWIRFMISPDEAGEEAVNNGPVFVSVNHEWAYVPRGEVVVMRELLFRHLNVSERRWKQNMKGHDENSKKRTPRWVDRYPKTIYGTVGLVKDGAPHLEEGDLLLAKGGTLAAAISKEQQDERERRAA